MVRNLDENKMAIIFRFEENVKKVKRTIPKHEQMVNENFHETNTLFSEK